jgi:hypothetical protein
MFKHDKAKIVKLETEIERLRESLSRIAHPVWWMQEDQRQKTGTINGINGEASNIANDAVYLQDIANKALKGISAEDIMESKRIVGLCDRVVSISTTD